MVLSLKELCSLTWWKYTFLINLCISNVAVTEMCHDDARIGSLSGSGECGSDDSFHLLSLSHSPQILSQGHSLEAADSWVNKVVQRLRHFCLTKDSSNRQPFIQTSLLDWQNLINPKPGLKVSPAESCFFPPSLFYRCSSTINLCRLSE